MDPFARQQAETAVKAFEAAIAQGPQVKHEQIAAAVRCLIALRNRLLDRARAGEVDDALLARVNALVSLAHGAEQPLIGVHLHRMEQARDGVRAILSSD